MSTVAVAPARCSYVSGAKWRQRKTTFEQAYRNLSRAPRSPRTCRVLCSAAASTPQAATLEWLQSQARSLRPIAFTA